MGSSLGSLFGINKPHVDQTLANDPYAAEMRSRLLGIVDAYLQSHGITQHIPRENMPYELRNDSERGQIQQNKAQNASPDEIKTQTDTRNYYPTAPYGRPPLDTGAKDTPDAAKGDQAAKADPAANANQYSRAAMAAKLKAQSMGLDANSLNVPTPDTFADLDPEAQQRQMEMINGFLNVKGGKI